MTCSRSTQAERSCHVFSAASGPRDRRHFLFLARSPGIRTRHCLSMLWQKPRSALPKRSARRRSVCRPPGASCRRAPSRRCSIESLRRKLLAGARSARRKPTRSCRRIIARLGAQRRNRAHRSPNCSPAPIWRQGIEHWIAMLPPIDEIISNFELLDDWDERYRYLIELGRLMEKLPDDAYTDANKVLLGVTHGAVAYAHEDADAVSLVVSSGIGRGRLRRPVSCACPRRLAWRIGARRVAVSRPGWCCDKGRVRRRTV